MMKSMKRSFDPKGTRGRALLRPPGLYRWVLSLVLLFAFSTMGFAQGAPDTTASITVDAFVLKKQEIRIIDVTLGDTLVDCALATSFGSSGVTLDLTKGSTFAFSVCGTPNSFIFDVDTAGLVEIDPADDGFLSWDVATSTFTVGVPDMVDASVAVAGYSGKFKLSGMTGCESPTAIGLIKGTYDF